MSDRKTLDVSNDDIMLIVAALAHSIQDLTEYGAKRADRLALQLCGVLTAEEREATLNKLKELEPQPAKDSALN